MLANGRCAAVVRKLDPGSQVSADDQSLAGPQSPLLRNKHITHLLNSTASDKGIQPSNCRDECPSAN